MRGISVIQQKTKALEVDKSSSLIPCYVGQAPIWQVDDVNWQNLAGGTFLLNSTEEMKEKVGFIKPVSGVWPKEASLCCAAVYNLEVMLTAPIAIVVNKQAITVGEAESKEVVFAEGKAIIEGSNIVLSSVAIEGKEKGTDYKVAYDGSGQNVIITASADVVKATVTYSKVNTDSLTMSPDTFEEFDFFEQEIGVVPTTFGCPLWESESLTGMDKTVAQKLIEVLQNPLNTHWYGQGYIGLVGETISEATEDKSNYNNYKAKATWPCVYKGGYIYPLSVAYQAIKEKVDNAAGGIPYVSASNELIEMDYLCTASGAKVRLKEEDATELNNVGIATANFSNMQWVTWGVCMSNYSEANKDRIDADQLNDVAVQMKDYVSNIFQQKYARLLDKPMTKRQANDIVMNFSGVLTALVTVGALVSAKVEFLASENSTAQMADGEFTFTITETSTPPGKAIIGKVIYDPEALSEYYAGGEA